ncbi:MAG: methyltransferase domain-containing protein [Saprospiraceae bacterium]|nr:methyltransferase domain-containing protein [Saprospiraceae bacterium]
MKYIHGYSSDESNRLNDQADSLTDILHYDSIWPEGSKILEAGCGVGAQTKTIAAKNQKSNFVSIDISKESLAQAQEMVISMGLNNIEFVQASIFDLPFEDESFDHIFVCFLLEHLPNPIDALFAAQRVLKPRGTIMVIEGDHGSTYFHPDSPEATKAVQCQVLLQKQSGGDANIGRKLYPIFQEAGLKEIKVSPRQVYVDDSNPKLVEGFTKNTFTAMIQGIAGEAVARQLISPEDAAKGISDLLTTASGGGTFCYTFFKGIGIKG